MNQRKRKTPLARTGKAVQPVTETGWIVEYGVDAPYDPTPVQIGPLWFPTTITTTRLTDVLPSTRVVLTMDAEQGPRVVSVTITPDDERPVTRQALNRIGDDLDDLAVQAFIGWLTTMDYATWVESGGVRRNVPGRPPPPEQIVEAYEVLRSLQRRRPAGSKAERVQRIAELREQWIAEKGTARGYAEHVAKVIHLEPQTVRLYWSQSQRKGARK